MKEKYHKLKVIMFDRQINQTELAEKLDITQASLNAKLNGRSDFSIGEAEKIIKALNIENPSDIFFSNTLRDA